jgi:UDP-glucuronate decarboxylase
MNTKQKFYAGEAKNVLVTGGAGFLGSHLCDRLIQDGNNVICLDNFIGGNVNNIKPLLQNPKFRFINHDINKVIDFKVYPELNDFNISIRGIQEIYHLACPTSAKNFDKFRAQTLYANSIGTINMLEFAKFYKAKIIFTSSSVVYGAKKQNCPYFKETDLGDVNFIGPRSCYDEGKRFAETANIIYREVYGVDAKIVRIFRTYGPREALFDGQMVPDFVVQALNNKPMIIYGDENFCTSLCYVSDIIEGILAVMNSSEKGPFNLGDPQEYKLVDLANKIIKMTDSQSKIEFRLPLVFMTPLGLPDIGLIKEKIGWFPVTRIDDGLSKIVEYVKVNKMLLSPLISQYDQI